MVKPEFSPSRVNDKEHPPIADKVICVDFDATIFPWGELDSDAPYIRGAASCLRRVKFEKDFTIYILTSRMSPTWWRSEGWDDLDEDVHEYWWLSVANRLWDYDIPFDHITCEKVPAMYYIDDKAIEFTGDNWKEIEERICGV